MFRSNDIIESHLSRSMHPPPRLLLTDAEELHILDMAKDGRMGGENIN